MELVLNDRQSRHGDTTLYSLAEVARASWQCPESDSEEEDDVEDGADEDDDISESYNPPYAGLHSGLPQTLTAFSFRGPANAIMLRDMNRWIEKARDPTWLRSTLPLSPLIQTRSSQQNHR